MQDIDTLYARWISGDIDAEELESLRKEGVLDELERIVKTTDQWAMPRYDTKSGFEKYKQKYPNQEKQGSRINWTYIAAIVAILILGILAWIFYVNQKAESIQANPASNEMFAFEDGTNIILNDGSEVTYVLKDWENQRRVNLIGEAYFDVESGGGFDVVTGNGTVSVLGTQFNVRAWGNNLYVECYEGRVLVQAGEQDVILELNQSINIVNGKMNDKQAISNESPLWRNNSSRFFDEQLDVVFNELERQFDVTVKAPLINRSFSGIFNHDTLDNALHNICKPLGLSYTISKDSKEVLIE